MKFIILLLRVVPAIILLQTLYFKFTGSPESVFIFSTLKVEPWGRIFAGVVELIAAIILLIPKTQLFGAIMSLGIMAGAILSHIFILGIIVQNDSGLLFTLAIIVSICSALLIYLKKAELINILKLLRKK
ncbi:DoxX family protein [Fluviispira sanaruensis]|uniref:DoxX family protein n=1 Tax=Fluviispira sanaruensis TaxID=2493639 RepID=A0A4P2VMF5_FLUSA|nr:DoxX family protein [Fluviispira sanaruensis]BBH54141.1 DoxX family protein [Fluviispira sanaruensis]